MSYIEWQPGTNVPSPVYLDAGIVVSANVRSDTRYTKATQLLGELLATEASILLSVLTLSEALWAIAKLSYCELNNQKPSTHWNPELFRRHCQRIFEEYPTRMNAIHNMVRTWSEAGVNLDVVPSETPEFQQVIQDVPNYMEEHQLASADATHLAIAIVKAKSFVTTDSEFQKVAANELNIFHLSGR